MYAYHVRLHEMKGYVTMTVTELLSDLYEEHFDHLDFIENMNGGDCDCNVHVAMNLIHEYWQEDLDSAGMKC